MRADANMCVCVCVVKYIFVCTTGSGSGATSIRGSQGKNAQCSCGTFSSLVCLSFNACGECFFSWCRLCLLKWIPYWPYDLPYVCVRHGCSFMCVLSCVVFLVRSIRGENRVMGMIALCERSTSVLPILSKKTFDVMVVASETHTESEHTSYKFLWNAHKVLFNHKIIKNIYKKRL